MTVRDGRKLCLNGCFKVKPVVEFDKHPRSPDGFNSRCKPCVRRDSQIRRHGMTGEDKADIADEQGGCGICGRTNPGNRGWVVDHDRSCCPGDQSCPNCRRAVLCRWCNTALGYAQDDPLFLRRMADYLEFGVRLTDANGICESLERVHTRRTRRTYEEATQLKHTPNASQREAEKRGEEGVWS